jgi:predicted transposase YbfD/YdcC
MIIEEVKLVKDFRKNQGKRHELWVVWAIIVFALLRGNVTYKQMDNFCKTEKNEIIKRLGIPAQKLPSYATIRRVMMGTNVAGMRLMVQTILEECYQQKEGKEGLDWIAIDGKGLRNTLTDPENERQNMLVMVSWFSQATKLVIKAESYESKKDSESVKVRSMIETCGLTNKVFTLDALHCSKETTQVIIESKNDYLVTVKRNQIKLYNLLKKIEETQKPLTVYQAKDNSHGRYVVRKTSVFDGQQVQHKNYPHLQSFIKVERTGFRGNQEYEQTLYYISSQKLDAQTFAQKIQEHWLIENQVHWVKDVNFNEDKSRIRGLDVAEKFSLLVTLVLNIYRSLGFVSIKEGQSWLGKDWSKILAIA